MRGEEGRRWAESLGFRHGAEAMLVVDEVGEVLAVSASAEEKLGLSPGTRLAGVGEDWSARLRPYVRVPLEVEARAVPGVGWWVLTVREPAPLRMSLADLTRPLLERSTMAWMQVGHELRAPLSAINGFCELLALERLPETARGHVREIQRTVAHMDGLLRQLADFARISGGAMRLDRVAVSLAPVVHQALGMMAPGAEARGVRLERRPLPALSVWADETALTRVLLNLLDNAIKYHEAGGRVWVEAETLGAQALVAVCDDGPGIPSDRQGRVFAPFERLGRRDGEGMGLGLALCRGLVRRMGGEMGLESPYLEERGCRFWFTLPRVTD